MRKKTTRRIRQSIVAGVVGVACIFGCENLEVAFAETATVTDATAEDATAGENGDDTDIESAETMFVGDTGVQADATGTDATEMEAYDEISGVSVLNANTQKTQVSNKKYEDEYHIDYILSHYSYFVQNDLEGDYVADTVGAIMVGNKLNLKNTVGKVKAAASYARYLIDLADYHAGSWNDTTGIDTNFYYTESHMSYKDWLTNRMVKVADDYINMDEAFGVIKQESQALEKAGQAGYMEQGDLIIDFADSKTITVSGTDFSNAKRVILKNVTAEDIFSNAYTISISGDGDYALDTGKIEIGGTPLNNNYFFNLAKNRPEGAQGGQYYSGGFGLVIAQNVNASSESHFYPYNVATTETTTTEATTTETTTTETTTTESTTTEITTTESTTTESTTTEVTTTESTTTENGTTTEIATTTETATTRAALVVNPKASSTSTQVQTPVVVASDDTVKTGDSMALGIVITLLVASGGGLLLFTALHEHKKK